MAHRRSILLLLLLPLCLPNAASGFQNGRAQPSDLVPIFTPQRGRTAHLAKGPIAASWNTLNLCAVADSRPLSPGDSEYQPAATAYRPLRIQVIFKRIFGKNAAPPGRSNHGSGRAVDTRNDRGQQRWIDANGPPFGWSKRTSDAPWERWHYSAYLPVTLKFKRPDPGASFRYPRLRRGSGGRCQGPAVRELQRRLRELGHYGGAIDGEFGKGTSKGVRKLQKSKGFRKYLKKHNLKRSDLGVVQSAEWIAARKVTREIKDVNGGGSTVRPNSAGQDVRAVQGLLNARLNELRRGHLKVAVDGVWDKPDKRALKKFQHLVGLKATGVSDPKTYAALRKPRNQNATRLDNEGIIFITQQEGMRTKPYNDSAGHCTVGVGHLIHYGRCNSNDFARYRGFTQRDALKLLKRDASSRERAVTSRVRVPRRQVELDASVSLVFNIGENGWAKSTVLRKWNASDRRGAADAFLLWHRGGRPYELMPRRRRERALFLRR